MADSKVEVKCADCGYLSRRITGRDGSPFFEVTTKERSSGKRPDAVDRVGVAIKPHCYVRSLPIAQEYDAETRNKFENHQQEEAFISILNRNRTCNNHCAYQEGVDPEGHKAMMDAKDITNLAASDKRDALDRAERQQDKLLVHQTAESDKVRDWQESQAEKTRIWQEAQETKRLAEQRERDGDQHEKQTERERQLAAINHENQMKREAALASIQHGKQIDRDAILDRKQLKGKVLVAVITATLTAVFSAIAFFGGQYFATPSTSAASTVSTTPATNTSTPPTK